MCFSLVHAHSIQALLCAATARKTQRQQLGAERRRNPSWLGDNEVNNEQRVATITNTIQRTDTSNATLYCKLRQRRHTAPSTQIVTNRQLRTPAAHLAIHTPYTCTEQQDRQSDCLTELRLAATVGRITDRFCTATQFPPRTKMHCRPLQHCTTFLSPCTAA